MYNYQELVQDILDNGYEEINERTGTGTLKVFGRQLRFDLKKGFPLVTTKKVHLKSVIHELLWMISGSTNIRYLVLNGVRIWNEWPFQNYLEAIGRSDEFQRYSLEWKEELKIFVGKIKQSHEFSLKWGDLGPVYGKQWRNFGGIDQLKWLEEEIKRNPANRRLLVSAWNPPFLDKMALPPCHIMYQFFVKGDELSCLMFIRSWDVFLGGPFNIAQYALLTKMMAQATNLEASELIIHSGDTHLYLNHLDKAKEQLTREPRPLPTMTLNSDVKSIFDFDYEDFTLHGYDPHPHIKAEVSV